MSVIRNFFSFLFPAPEVSGADDEQTEVSRVSGTIWNLILSADDEGVKRLCEENPKVMEQRGAVGELPLHMCFLFNSPKHLQIAKWIMDHFPQTITATYLGAEYGGENILHIAIINQDFNTVKELVGRGRKDLLTARATGKFFQPGSACYYGEYPLAFACCTNQPDIATFLLDSGADICCADSQGNTILHLLVIHNLPEMYAFVKSEYKKRIKGEGVEKKDGAASPRSSAPDDPAAIPAVDLWMRKNQDGLTPFCLAAKTNAEEMFTFLLQETKQTQWTYGPVSCDLYPLLELDLAIPTGDGGEQAGPGALELIMNEGNVNLLMHPRMLDLVSQKWTKFAQRIFKQRFRTVLIYLVIFAITVIVSQTVDHIADKEEARMAALEVAAAAGAGEGSGDGSGSGSGVGEGSGSGSGSDAAEAAEPFNPHTEYIPWAYFIYQWPIFLWILQGIVLFGAWYKGSKEFGELYRSGWRDYFSSTGSALLENSLSCFFCACIGLVFVLSIFDSPAVSAVLAMASLAGWSYLFFFLLAFRLTGPMVVMIHQMLMNDVLRFCLIYLVFLMGFAQAFFVLFESVGWGGFIVSIKTCFVAMLGDFELDQFADTPYTAVSVGLLVVYVVTITILLLNLLIAMMGDTYEKINESAEMQWHLERARIIFAIENELSKEERENPINKYWTLVDGARFLQVLEVNPNHFKNKKEEEEGEEGEEDGDKKKD